MSTKNIIIIGAAGRDFHNFNTFSGIMKIIVSKLLQQRRNPILMAVSILKSFAGKLYPEGIPIYSEAKLPELIKELSIDDCIYLLQ
jgi:predicted GTPase